MADLSSKDRNALPDSAFALPKTRQYPIHDRSHAVNALARASGKPEEAQVNAAVHKRYPSLKKADASVPALPEGDGLTIDTPIWKDDTQRLVYGVVMSPGIMDSQGDVVDASEIQKAAHRFLTDYRQHDIQHQEQRAGVETVESFCAPSDMQIAGKKIVKGAWVMGLHVADANVWDRVHKKDHPNPLTGLSIGGSAIREPIPG